MSRVRTLLLPGAAAALVVFLVSAIVVAPRAVHKRYGETAQAATTCRFTREVVDVEFDPARYPTVYAHYRAAVERGWPRVLVLERTGAGDRRDRLLRDRKTIVGQDRDEYPPAVGRLGWLGDVDYVPSAENRSHGASLGARLRPYCDGVEFRYVWR